MLLINVVTFASVIDKIILGSPGGAGRRPGSIVEEAEGSASWTNGRSCLPWGCWAATHALPAACPAPGPAHALPPASGSGGGRLWQR